MPISLQPDRSASWQLPEEQFFNDHYARKASTGIRETESVIWEAFIQRWNIHDREDKRRFLDFVERTRRELKYSKNHIYTLRDLERWYGQHCQGEPHGTKR